MAGVVVHPCTWRRQQCDHHEISPREQDNLARLGLVAPDVVAPGKNVRSMALLGSLPLHRLWVCERRPFPNADENYDNPDDPDKHDDDVEEDDDRLVTREMLHRDLLKDPKVIRKNKKGKAGYKPLDNRDHLPFSVRKVTPDPYTHS